MPVPDQTPFFRAWTVGLIAALAILAFLVPIDWIGGVQNFFGADRLAVHPFEDNVAQVEQALALHAPLPVTREEFLEIETAVQARRIYPAGPWASEDIRTAMRILHEYNERLRHEPYESGQDVVHLERSQALVEAFPRLDASLVHQFLDRYREELSVATFLDLRQDAPVKEVPGGNDCAVCHQETRPLPEPYRLDVSALWPHIDPEAFDGGRRFPVMMDVLDLEAMDQIRGLEARTCNDCHVAHGRPGFGVSSHRRSQNMGLWARAWSEEDHLRVQVKVQNKDAGHGAPAGPLSRAYVVVVRAVDSDFEDLEFWFGHSLPPHLKTGRRQAGLKLARWMVDKDGAYTADVDLAVGIQKDTRLESDRHLEEDFLFVMRDGDAATRPVDWRVDVELYWLADYADWSTARLIRRITRRDGE